MRIIIVLIFIFPSFYFSQTSYVDSVEFERKQKQEHLRDTSAGVLNSQDLKEFNNLDFFDIDTEFIIKASWTKDKGRKFKMPTSTEREPIYRRYGYLTFEVAGKTCKLTVYQNMGLRKEKEFKNYFFIPFYDETSGITSYGGGRYLDIYLFKKQSVIDIDFNQCYNPYCAYSNRYSCPIPPVKNTLNVAIVAGEKTPLYHSEH